jgi:hypothetical protein
MGNFFDKALSYVGQSHSQYKLSYPVSTTFNSGLAIPVGTPIEVIPGGTYKGNVSAIVRTSTMLRPVMDYLEFEMHFFFVKMIDIWDN